MSPRKEPTSQEEILCHPLFVSTLEAKGPLSRPIETIDVERMKGAGPKKRFVFVDWRFAKDLPDERALAEVFGAGLYKLTGKNLERNCFIRSTTVEVDGDDDDDDDEVPPTAPAPPPQQQTSLAQEFLMMMREDRKAAELRHEREMVRAQQNTEAMLQTVTTFARSAVEMAVGSKGGGMKEAMELTKMMRDTENEARLNALAEREAIEESMKERQAEQGGKDGDLIDAALNPVMSKLGEKLGEKLGGQPS